MALLGIMVIILMELIVLDLISGGQWLQWMRPLHVFLALYFHHNLGSGEEESIFTILANEVLRLRALSMRQVNFST